MTPEEYLTERGLTLDEAAELGISALTAAETAAHGRWAASVPSIKFRYRDLRRNPTGFYRLRYLEEVRSRDGDNEIIRYQQPPGSLTGVYLPTSIRWGDVYLDVKRPILILEGEAKANCACKIGGGKINAIGLGGVNSFQSNRYGIEMLDPLPMFAWKDRSVIICFDSDAQDKPEVLMAQTRLATLLTNKGAHVTIVKVPAPPQGDSRKKWGLDDFLLHPRFGLDGFEDLLTDAMAPSEATELWNFNATYAAILKPPAVMDIRSGEFVEPGKFTTFYAANKFYYADAVSKQGHKTRTKLPTAPRWLKWEERREYVSLDYRPGGAPAMDLPDGRQALNIWPGWAIQAKEPTRPEDLAPWRELLDFTFASEPSVRNWFECWMAYPLQVPGGKLFSYCLLWSPIFGIGKTTIPYVLMDIYGKVSRWGEGNAQEVDGKSITGKDNFNAWANRKQFLYVDELSGKDSRHGSEQIRSLTTAETLTVNLKFIQTFTIRNVINMMLSSNSPDAMFTDKNDRRPFIHEVWGPRLPDSFYENFAEWRKNGGASYVFWDLLHKDLTGFNSKAPPPDSAAKRNMARLSMSEAAMWTEELQRDPTGALQRASVRSDKAVGCDLWSPKQLVKLYDPMDNKKIGEPGMGKQLALAGCRKVNGGNLIRMSTGVHDIYAIRNTGTWMRASLGEIRTHWERWHGTPGWKDE